MIPAEKPPAILDRCVASVRWASRDLLATRCRGRLPNPPTRRMPASPPSRLVAFHVAARADDAAIRAALSAAEVVHETDPLIALAALGCRELAARNRGTWGLGPIERFAVVLGDDRPELEQLKRACELHLPAVELWRVANGRFVRLETARVERSPASPPPRTEAPSAEAPPRVVTAEEIRMLLGGHDDDSTPPREREGEPR